MATCYAGISRQHQRRASSRSRRQRARPRTPRERVLRTSGVTRCGRRLPVSAGHGRVGHWSSDARKGRPGVARAARRETPAYRSDCSSQRRRDQRCPGSSTANASRSTTGALAIGGGPRASDTGCSLRGRARLRAGSRQATRAIASARRARRSPRRASRRATSRESVVPPDRPGLDPLPYNADEVALNAGRSLFDALRVLA
jgi:hypothetical protein